MVDAAVQHEIVLRLRECLAQRRIQLGFEILAENRAVLGSVGVEFPGSAELIGYLAQWVDEGFSSPELIETFLASFATDVRVQLPLIEYVHLRFSEGALAMWREDYECAIRHFRFVTSVQEEAPDNELIAVCHFWMGRCLRKIGHYDEALTVTTRARDMAMSLGYSRMAAMMRVGEAWLLFQKAKTADALRILKGAESDLADSDDFVALGNIESAYGRIARRQGQCDRAIAHFKSAIALYSRHDPDHRSVARSLVNLVVAQRQTGLQLQRKLDSDLLRRKSGKLCADPKSHGIQQRAALEAMRQEARQALDRADSIYRGAANHRGLGAVHVMRGFLNVDVGRLDAAMEDASAAFRLAEEKSDHILMARARILQCMIESTRFEEGIEDTIDPGTHAQRACDLAREALAIAQLTENRRLVARAYVWQGLIWANRYFNDIDAARRCCDEASALLRPEGQPYIWEDLRRLRNEIVGNTQVDTVLREWSQGLIGDRTFQQVNEEFAAIIIPRVWERESRKVSRVAAKLSVSPKKVRRILQAAGLLRSSPPVTAPPSRSG